MKLDNLQASCLMVQNTESLSELEIRDIKQSKYPINYGHREVFVGKLRELLDCEDVRRSMRVVVICEADVVVEGNGQVFSICLELFHLLQYNIRLCK